MPRTKIDDPAELLRLALTGLNTQIAELQQMRAQLAAMINGRSAGPAVEAAEPTKRGKLSAETRAKISAAAKARWTKVKKAQAKNQKPKPIAKQAHSKTKPAKGRPAPAKAKKSSAKTGKSRPLTPAGDTD